MAEVRNLRTLLQSLCSGTEGETVSVTDLLNAVGRRSYGPVILLLGFIAISPLTIIPGANVLVALITLYAYGVSHFGLRMRHLWMTFGLIAAAWNVLWWETRRLPALRAAYGSGARRES